MITVNQFSFMGTLFPDLLPMNWFATTYVHDQALSRPVLLWQLYNKDWFTARNICDDEVLTNLTKISYKQIVVGLQ